MPVGTTYAPNLLTLILLFILSLSLSVFLPQSEMGSVASDLRLCHFLVILIKEMHVLVIMGKHVYIMPVLKIK